MIPVQWHFTLRTDETNAANPHLIHLPSNYPLLLFGAGWNSSASASSLSTTFTITRSDGSVEYVHLTAGQQQVDHGMKVGVDVHRPAKVDDEAGTVTIHILGLS
jgi:hypothetical protein